jgi:penicillin-binding protein 1C
MIARLFFKHQKAALICAAFCICCAGIWIAWPIQGLDKLSYSRVVYDGSGNLLRVTLASDEQLRFPLTDSLPPKYIAALLCREDRRYFWHPGIDPAAVVKSAFVNIHAGKRVRGGSTITMQLVRLLHPRKRTYLHKVLETTQALRISLRLSKHAVLKLYAACVPMGGNTVGVETAARRYFGKSLALITWSEAALLAVLPNAPSLIHLEKNRPLLKHKRDRLLYELCQQKVIDAPTRDMALLEELPQGADALPFYAPHFTNYTLDRTTAQVCTTTLDIKMQQSVEMVLASYSRRYGAVGIHNGAAIVIHTRTRRVHAYCGSQNFFDSLWQGQVDGVQAPRSTGSLLKPYLAARALDLTEYSLESKLQDVPTYYGSFAPRNASGEFCGLVSLEEALVRSLNVPFVRLLYQYGVDNFYRDLKSAGFSHLFRLSEGYGLSIILGGAEASLWDLTRLFSSFGNSGVMKPLQFLDSGKKVPPDSIQLFSDGAAWQMLTTLNKLNRPGIEYYWQRFPQQIQVAWKTGTSFGQKDGWAIGVTPQWTVGVWIGNFNGTGNTMLGGAETAGPVLFDIFNALPFKDKGEWFNKPEYDLKPVTLCKQSGLCPGADCTDSISVERPANALKTKTCPFHRRYFVDLNGYEVCSRCWNESSKKTVVRAIYPPVVQAILSKQGAAIDTVPAHALHCPIAHVSGEIEILYPTEGITVFVPRNFHGQREKIIFQAEGSVGRKLFWYLDGAFLCQTLRYHSPAIALPPGHHQLVVQDDQGMTRSVPFESVHADD